MTNATLTATEKMITTAASQIAGACYDDAEGTLAERLQSVHQMADLGSDGDLTQADRDAIATLIGLLDGEKFTLCDYRSGDQLRTATADEVCRCAVAQANDCGVGAFDADGRTCHVE